MLGWILLGLATVAVGVIVISGTVTKNRIREQMQKRNIKKMLVTQIDSCTNTVKLSDLYSDQTMEIRGDDVSNDLDECDVIRI